MSKKKKGLGRDVEKSLEIMKALTGNLKEFVHMPLKQGLSSNKVADEKLVKAINAASEEAIALYNKISDLQETIKTVKSPGNSRFARKVVSNFLERSSI